MAEKKTIIPYKNHLSALEAEGPGRLYLLYGEEDFLRDRYLERLRAMCLGEDDSSFNDRRLTGPKLDLNDLREAVDAAPFLSERTFTEIRDVDLASVDAEGLKKILSDIPDWATLAFVYAPGNTPKGTLSAMKTIKKLGTSVEFTEQSSDSLQTWVARHFRDQGCRIDAQTASYFLYVCGSRMNTLLPEILKVSGHASNGVVTREDVDAVARRAPETTVFEMTDAIGARDYNRAASHLADLLADRDETPQRLLYMLTDQIQRLYAAKVFAASGRQEALVECFPNLAKWDFLRRKLYQTASAFSTERLARAVSACARCDLASRSTGGDAQQLLKELLLSLALDTNDA